MPKEKKYLSGQDVALRWSGCILKFKDDFYFASNPERDSVNTTIHLYPVAWTGREEPSPLMRIDANDDGLEIASPQLGFINSGGIVYHIIRSPVRRQKQGICRENLLQNRVGFDHPTSGFALDLSMFRSKGMLDMLKNKYPTYEKALTHADKGHSMAFHRDWAVISPLATDGKDAHCRIFFQEYLVANKKKSEDFLRFLPQYDNSVTKIALEELGVRV